MIRYKDDGTVDLEVTRFLLTTHVEALPQILADALDAANARIQSLTEGGVGLIAAERKRQVGQEGWTPEHDDEHTDKSLARAAVCYATPKPLLCMRYEHGRGYKVPAHWPESWSPLWWKPKDRISDLVRAGALIAAEIDRLQRAALSGGEG